MTTRDLMSRALDALQDEDESRIVDVVHGLVGVGDVSGPLGIAEVADLLGVSAHTLRYYERAGLVTVPRDPLGRRAYDDVAVRRLVFISRMRLSGMSMRDLQHYVGLVERGEQTVAERLAMMVEQRVAIQRRIRELQLSLAATEYKITRYGGDIAS
jgi:DNA-binding transcriptional MerR regulator